MSGSSSSCGPTAGSSSQGPPTAGGSSSINFPTGNSFPGFTSSRLTGDPAFDLDAIPGADIYPEGMKEAAQLRQQLDESFAKMLEIAGHLPRPKAEEAKPQDGTVYTEADVPPLVEALSSKDEKAVFGAVSKLSRISDTQKDLLHSAVLPLFPDILSHLFAAPTETRVRDIAGLVMHTSTRTREASDALVKHVDLEALFRLILRTSSPAVRDMLIGLVENIMQTAAGCKGNADGGKMESRVTEIMHTQFYRFEVIEEDEGSDGAKVKGSGKGKTKAPEAVKWNTAEALNAIKSFKFIMSRKLLSPFCTASVKAGVLQFLLHIATTPSVGPDIVSPPADAAPGAPPTLSALRAAAVGSLSDLYLDIVEQFVLPEDFPRAGYQVDSQFDLQGKILMPLLDMLDDPDLPVSDKIVDLLYSRFNDLDQAVQMFLLTNEGAMRKLIRKLAIGSASGMEGKGRGKQGTRAKGGRPGFLETFGSKLGFGISPPEEEGPSEHSDAMQLIAEKLGLAASPPSGGQSGEEQQRATENGSATASVCPAKTGDNEEPVDEIHVSSPDVDELKRNRVMAEMIAALGDAPLVEMAGGGKQAEDDMMDTDGEAKGKGVSEETADTEMMDLGAPGETKHQNSGCSTEIKHEAKPSHSHSSMVMNIGAPTLGLSDRFLSVLDKMNAFPKTEPLLRYLIGVNREGVVEAFSEFWLCEGLEAGMKEKLVHQLSGIHGPVRTAAFTAGIPVPSGSGVGGFSPFI